MLKDYQESDAIAIPINSSFRGAIYPINPQAYLLATDYFG